MDPTGEFSKMIKERMPVGRFGEVNELANLATYLVSDYANWLTGEVCVLPFSMSTLKHCMFIVLFVNKIHIL